MAKKREAPQKARQKAPQLNPFELKTKGKKKFDVTGKRQGKKAGQKNVIQARQEAVDKRKKTMLVEYKQLRKANTFIDRRFGESDPNMSEDAKAVARLQQQHVRDEARRNKKKGGQKFVLSEHEEANDDGSALGGLTHLGKNIADMDGFNDAPPDLDELDDDMVQDLVESYNFGGGGDAGEGAEKGGSQNKTRKQVMEEIIAKSKMYKAIKARQREEDEDELEKLNSEFQGLVKHHALKSLLKPPGHNKDLKVVADVEADAAYDVAARALAAEARGAAGDRVLGPEEQAERERTRMEMLEKERLRRMRGTGNEDDAAPGPSGLGGPEGGYAARRKKMKEREQEEGSSSGGEEDASGSDGEGSSGSEEELDAGCSALEKRRMEQAAGDHPLQNTFRLQAAQLLEKYGVDSKNPLVPSNDDDSGGEDKSGDEDNDSLGEREGGSGDGDGKDDGSDLEGVSGSGVSEEGVSSGVDSVEQLEVGEKAEGEREQKEKLTQLQRKLEEGLRQREKEGSKQEGKHGNQQQHQQRLGSKEEQQHARALASGTLELQGPQDLPYTIKMPESYPKFAALVRNRSAEDLAIVISRIRGFNATALAADSKRGLQILYGMLIQHFALLAGESPVPMAHLDAMVPLLLPMTAEVPFYAATVARARLKHMHKRLSSALANNPASAGDGKPSSSPWPTARTLLQLKLLTTLFPVSDRRHPVITPASLLVCKYLSQCVAGSLGEVACGLLLVGLALHIACPAQRYSPEPLVFLTDALWSYLGPNAAHPASLSESANNSSHVNGSNRGGKKSSKGSKQQGGGKSSSAAGPTPTLAREGGLSMPHVAPGLLAPSAQGPSLSSVEPEELQLMPWLERVNCSAGSSGSGKESGTGGESRGERREAEDRVRLGMLGTVLKMLSRSASLLRTCEAAPEALTPPLRALQALGRVLALPPSLEQHRQTVASELASISQHVIATRRPLVQANRIRAPVIREYNPRFEDGFSLGRDYDPDRERAEQRKLKRMVQKEKRGALRELRKDATFMADVRDKERAKVDAERMGNEKRFYSELQSFEANMRSGGQGGMNPHLKRRKK